MTNKAADADASAWPARMAIIEVLEG